MFELLLLALLPWSIAPAPPFPAIETQAPTHSMIAPGVEYAEYDLLTLSGPLSIHVVALDPRRPDLRIVDALAHDRLISSGESVASMAVRLDAVAGINGDYFDIGQTNQPLGLVVDAAALLRQPLDRVAFTLTKDGRARLATETFAGTLQIGTQTYPVDGWNAYPPPGGGISLILPSFGRVPPNDDISLYALEALGSSSSEMTYRLGPASDNTQSQPPGSYLAIGLNAYGSFAVPPQGATLAIRAHLAPIRLRTLQVAIGGGPRLLRASRPALASAGPVFAQPIPSSGLGITANGDVLLVEVDGRDPVHSIGLTRPQFTALFRALGATDAMALDGGGSSTLVARLPGEAAPGVLGRPSDGRGRRVGDALLIQSLAPVGPATQLAAIPQTLRLVVGAERTLRVGALDAGLHPVALAAPVAFTVEPTTLGSMLGARFVADTPGRGSIEARAGAFALRIPVEVVATPARMQILPIQPAVAPGARVKMRLLAYDAYGYRLTLPQRLGWTTSVGSISPSGELRAAGEDAVVRVALGSAQALRRILVGFHDEPLGPLAAQAHFATYPVGAPGSLLADPASSDAARLTYDFTAAELGAYARLRLPLAARAVGIAFDVISDGGGETLRIGLRDASGSFVPVGAVMLTEPGLVHVSLQFPRSLRRPAQLDSIYVVRRFGARDAPVAGSIVIEHARLRLAGNPAGGASANDNSGHP